MPRRLLLALPAILAALGGAAPARAADETCNVPTDETVWVDYAGHDAPITPRPGLVLAFSSGTEAPAAARAAGAATAFFDVNFNKRVGTPTAPADPATIDDRARRLYEFAVSVTGCTTPLIAENELFGAYTTTPWSPGNAQYRANVLALLRGLAARGARVYLNVAHPPYTGGEAGEWWRQAAQAAVIVRQVFFTNPSIPRLYRQAPARRSRALRSAMRGLVRAFTEIGVPPGRVGLSLQFVSTPGQGGREGLQPASAWFTMVGLQAFAAREVAAELGLDSIWSWGWATFSAAGADEDKAAAACVYLWARNPDYCDAPAFLGEGFDPSLGSLASLPPGVRCSVAGQEIVQADADRLARLTGSRDIAATALLERAVARRPAPVGRARLLAAEQAVVARRFGGSETRYLAQIRRLGLTLPLVRDLLAHELRVRDLGLRLVRQAPGDAAVARFYDEQGALLVRPVEVEPAPRWLGNRSSGLALAGLAPLDVLGLPATPTRVWTLDGPLRVRALGAPVALAAVPLAAARPAIRSLLVAAERDDAYRAWTLKRQAALRRTADCVRDDVPAAGVVDMGAYVPFLAGL